MSDVRFKMNGFFCDVQAKTLKQIEFAIKDRDEAMDILQDAMIRLAKKYADKNEQDWPRLFQRIVQNLICDWHRRKKVRSILVWWDRFGDEAKPMDEAYKEQNEGSYEISPQCANDGRHSPEYLHSNFQLGARVTEAVGRLPLRQQQAFTLRAWWGHDVQETAFAMGCSEGSVKTHYSRATARLKEILGDIE